MAKQVTQDDEEQRKTGHTRRRRTKENRSQHSLWFDLTGVLTMIYHTQGDHADHYNTDVAHNAQSQYNTVKLSTAVQPSWSEGGTTRHKFGSAVSGEKI